jgi:hypothetical protein
MQFKLKQLVFIIFSTLLMTACSTIESSAISPDIDLFDWENDGVVIMGTVSATDHPVAESELKKITSLYETVLTERFSHAILAVADDTNFLTSVQARHKLGKNLYLHLLNRYKHTGSLSNHELSEIKEKLPDTRFVMVMHIIKNTIKRTTTKDPVNEDNKKRITTHSVRIIMNIFDTKTGKKVYQVTSFNSADETYTLHSSNFLGEVLDVMLLDKNGYPEPAPTNLIVKAMATEDVSDLYRSLEKNL